MSQKPKNKAQKSKEKEDKDSVKQMKRDTHDDAPKPTFDTKESKEPVDEKELRRRAKDSESTAQQLITDLLEEKEKQQKEMQKLQDENIKLRQSDERKTKMKKKTTDEVRELEHLDYCLDSLLQDRHHHVHSGPETTPEAIKQPAEIQTESSLGKTGQHVKEIREMFIKLKSVNGELKDENLCLNYLMDALHSCVTSERKTKDISLELPDDIKCHSSLASIYKTAENIAKKFKETEILSQVTKEEEERKQAQKAESFPEKSYKNYGTQDRYTKTREELETGVKELTKEKNQLLNRLSEIGAMKLTENNPNVTDLSDANRPEKLVEHFSELYDNVWTDAYEHLTKKQGKPFEHSVKLLFLVLKDTYGICLSSTKEKETTLRKAMLCYAGLSDEDSSEFELQEIEKKMSEYRTKKSHCNVTRVEKDVKQKFINRPDQFKTDMSSTLTAYIDGCVRICWFMSIKNPPMHLDFGDKEENVATNGTRPAISHFDNSKFVFYTKSGDSVDYIVWPAVYLYKGGPILRKGVAQASHA